MVDAIRRSVTHARTPTSSVEQILFRILPRPEIVRGHPFEPSSHFRGPRPRYVIYGVERRCMRQRRRSSVDRDLRPQRQAERVRRIARNG